MLESEAKTKWCPVARVYGTNCAVNRGSGIDKCLCLGSDCMMFVITVEGSSYKGSYGGHVPCETEGYCGLTRATL